VLAVLLSVSIGVLIGAASGFWPGTVGTLLLGLTDFALALPRVVLLLLLASLWQPSAALVVAVLGVTGWMTVARLVHGEVRALSARWIERNLRTTDESIPAACNAQSTSRFELRRFNGTDFQAMPNVRRCPCA